MKKITCMILPDSATKIDLAAIHRNFKSCLYLTPIHEEFHIFSDVDIPNNIYSYLYYALVDFINTMDTTETEVREFSDMKIEILKVIKDSGEFNLYTRDYGDYNIKVLSFDECNETKEI